MPISKEFQLSENKKCIDCYNKINKESFDSIIELISKKNFAFEGNCIIENKLYLGNITSAFLKDKLKEIGIIHF
jgi:hypothetical protein